MIILSHRGYWKSPAEKNSVEAFERSFAAGFGTETDFRDLSGELVVSHDPPRGGCLTVENLLKIHARINPRLPLAINIKADGLQALLKASLQKHRLQNYFLFDMSIPDAFRSVKEGLPIFVRHSDIEPHLPLPLYEHATGVWLDAFHNHSWITSETIQLHLGNHKSVCLVSPELHGRDPFEFWHFLKYAPPLEDDRLLLCTDSPEEAKLFFSK